MSLQLVLLLSPLLAAGASPHRDGVLWGLLSASSVRGVVDVCPAISHSRANNVLLPTLAFSFSVKAKQNGFVWIHS